MRWLQALTGWPRATHTREERTGTRPGSQAGTCGPEALYTPLGLRDILTGTREQKRVRTASTHGTLGGARPGSKLVNISWLSHDNLTVVPKAGEGPSLGLHSPPGVQPWPRDETNCRKDAGQFLSPPSGQVTPGHKGWDGHPGAHTVSLKRQISCREAGRLTPRKSCLLWFSL